MSKKKPTAMELKNAITNLIVEYGHLLEAFKKLDYLVGKYIDFKNDSKEFKKFLEKESEKVIKDMQQDQDKEAK